MSNLFLSHVAFYIWSGTPISKVIVIGEFVLFQDILKKVHLLSPRALVIDSIQTVYLNDVNGSAGGLTQVRLFPCSIAYVCRLVARYVWSWLFKSWCFLVACQVKECTSALLRFAKKTDIPVLLVSRCRNKDLWVMITFLLLNTLLYTLFSQAAYDFIYSS